MKYSHKLSDAMHVLAYINIYRDGDLSSAAIAESVESNPSLIRRLMSELVKAGLLTSQPGVVKPRLARPAAEISLLDVYTAIDGDHRLLHVDEKTNPACIVGSHIQDSLNAAYDSVQQVAEAQMASITLQSVIDDLLTRQAQQEV